MIKTIERLALTYDDISLVPCLSDVKSRLDVNLSSFLGTTELDLPVFTAPMDTITGLEMAKCASMNGATGVVHRFQSMDDRKAVLEYVLGAQLNCCIAVGFEDPIAKICADFYDAEAIVIDVANAHTKYCIEFLKALKYQLLTIVGTPPPIIVGNVCTYEGTIDLARAGADIIKVGIGSGAVCSTRIQTGMGIPMVTALLDARKAVEHHCLQTINFPRVKLIADGGIRNSGDGAKAIACGANYVMIGSMIAGTAETPGALITKGGADFKEYRGMASKEAQNKYKGGLKKGTVEEGISTYVPYKGSAKNVFQSIEGGLRSAFTYVGARTIEEFYQNTEIIQVTQNGAIEATPHILRNK